MHIFRNLAQKSLDIRQYACGISIQSDEKSVGASSAQVLCSVSLKGEVNGALFNRINKYEVKSVKAEKGTVFPRDCSSLFSGFEKCSEMDLSEVDTSQVADMTSMFEKCRWLTKLDLSSFDTSTVMSMEEMFSRCTSLK